MFLLVKIAFTVAAFFSFAVFPFHGNAQGVLDGRGQSSASNLMPEGEGEYYRDMPRMKIPVNIRPEGVSAPVEPDYPEVKYLSIQPPPQTVEDHIDALMNGITVDIPPEYDHYGYEIRRYMAHAGGADVWGDRFRLPQEFKNVYLAKIVFDFWRRDLEQKTEDIQAALERDQAISPDIHAKFKYNKKVISTFLNKTEIWLDSNYDFLEYLKEIWEFYDYDDPVFTFREIEHRERFTKLYNKKNAALEDMYQYPPFKDMVY